MCILGYGVEGKSDSVVLGVKGDNVVPPSDSIRGLGKGLPEPCCFAMMEECTSVLLTLDLAGISSAVSGSTLLMASELLGLVDFCGVAHSNTSRAMFTTTLLSPIQRLISSIFALVTASRRRFMPWWDSCTVETMDSSYHKIHLIPLSYTWLNAYVASKYKLLVFIRLRRSGVKG
jgi:hypothetical protein